MVNKIYTKQVKVGKLDIRYLNGGEGDPLIVIHGGGGGANAWLQNAMDLSRYYSVYIPDLPGFGHSQSMSDNFSLSEFVAFLEEFSHNLGLKHFHLMGHSIGGCIALHYALKFPHKIRRLVLYDIDLLPVAMDRGGTNIMAEIRGDLLAIWLDPDEDFDKNQMLIAEAFVYFELLSEEYPHARVADTLPPGVSRTGWELISETLTQTVLQLPRCDRLEKAGFPVDKLAKDSLEATKKRLLAPDYLAPDRNEVRAKTVPLEVMALYFSLEEDSAKQELQDLVAKRTPGYVKDIECLLKAVHQTGHETREKCVQLMVKCRNCLIMLDSCLIVDPKERLVYYSSGSQAY